ncbi:MAG: VOC family protein [Thermoplasmatota archaeon]
MDEPLQGVIPMVAYAKGDAAIAWLEKTFGFRARNLQHAPDGRLTHGELDTGHGIVMVATPSPAYHGPRQHAGECTAARSWLAVPWIVDGVLVYVDDVKAHFDRAQAHGANLLSPLEEGGPGTRYRVEDIEGHRWMFMQRPANPVPHR